jgi:hypothetical protein
MDIDARYQGNRNMVSIERLRPVQREVADQGTERAVWSMK